MLGQRTRATWFLDTPTALHLGCCHAGAAARPRPPGHAHGWAPASRASRWQAYRQQPAGLRGRKRTRCAHAAPPSLFTPPPPLCAAIFVAGWALQSPVRPLHASILLLTKAHPHNPASHLAQGLPAICASIHTHHRHSTPLPAHLSPMPRTSPPPLPKNPCQPPHKPPPHAPSAGSSRARACRYPRHQSFGPDDGALVRKTHLPRHYWPNASLHGS